MRSARETKVHLDLCLYDGNCFPFFPMPDGTQTQPVPPILTRLTFDLAGNSDGLREKAALSRAERDAAYRRPLSGQALPPRLHDLVSAAPTARAPWAISIAQPASSRAGSRAPIPASRSRNSCRGHPDAPEGDGYILVLVNRMAENRSDLAILDAARLEAGPLALVKLPVRVRSTFHGMWVPARALKTGRYTN